MHDTEVFLDYIIFLHSMTTAPRSPDYVLQIDMWAKVESGGMTSEHARAKYETFRVSGDFFQLEVEFTISEEWLDKTNLKFLLK